jgi:large subunit ribosomal protein L25
MELIKVSATVRTQSGKGFARRLRQAGKIPGVVYGSDVKAQSIELSPKDVAAILGSEHGRNSAVELTLDDGRTLNVLLADYQHHPVARNLLHADFVHISLDQEIDIEVPFETYGKAKGVVLGGVLSQVFRKLPVRCKPADVPTKITFDVTPLEKDDHAHVSDLALPPGVTVRLPATQTVVSVVAEKREVEEVSAAAAAKAEGEAAKPEAEAAAGAAAKPAAAKPSK